MALENLQKERLKKLKNIEKLGVNPYPSKTVRKQTTAEARKKVAVAGRLRSLRPHGKITFADLEDATGKIQLFFSQNELPDKYDFLNNLDLGDFLQAEGEIFKTQAGEITIKVSSFQLLTKTLLPLPSSWYGLKDVEERYRERYVDLIINPEVKHVMEIRHKVIRFIRSFLENNGFVEVETPVLQPIYGGATAKPFLTKHNALGANFYLRIADELYLKRLMVAGFEKIFEIAKDFRNEGIDRQHSPEFTMLEFYWAYADYEDLMRLTEEMISKLVKEIHGSYKFEYEKIDLDFSPPFKRVTFNELIKKYCGIDLDKIRDEDILRKEIEDKGIELDLKGVVGVGPLIDELYKKMARSEVKQPTFIIDYPSEMKPLSKRKEKDPGKSASFQLLSMDFELVNAYNELNDPLEQGARWKEELKLAKRGLVEHQVLDADFIKALEYGMPPTAGFGMGIDRLVAILTDQHSLKDVILFPTLRPNLSTKKCGRLIKTKRKEGKSNINRNDALKIIEENVENKNIIKHMLATEAVMGALAQKLEPDKIDEWKLAGLLHDGDYSDKVPHNMQGIEISKWVEEKGFKLSDEVKHAMAAHNVSNTGVKPESKMDWALFCADTLTGLIVACALVLPSKKLSDVTVESILKKFNQPKFAAGTRRDEIKMCEEHLGTTLPEFVKINLEAMQGIASDLGL